MPYALPDSKEETRMIWHVLQFCTDANNRSVHRLFYIENLWYVYWITSTESVIFAMEHCDENITTEQAAEYQYSTISWSIILIFIPLVTAFGVSCNSAFIFVVHRVKAMRTTTNIFLINLAIADSLLLIVACIKSVRGYFNSPIYDFPSLFTGFECAVHGLLIYLCYYTSLWTVTLVSIERYLAVCHPLWHRLVNSKRRAIRLAVFSWFVSLLFASIQLPGTSTKTTCIVPYSVITHRISVCVYNCEWCQKTVFGTDLIQFIIALFLNIVLYSLIVRKLTKSTFIGVSELHISTSVRKRTETRNSVAKMLIVNGIVFFVCLTPFSIINLNSLGWIKLNVKLENPFIWIGRVMFLLNSALNPLIYNAANSRYRLAFKQAFHFKRCGKMYSLCNESPGIPLPNSVGNESNTRTSQLWIFFYCS